MFSRHHNDAALQDLSVDLRDEFDWKPGPLQTFDFPLDISALSVEPLAGLLAVGTASGSIHLFGGPSVHVKLALPEPIGVKLLQFSLATYCLVCVDNHNALHVWNLLEFGKPKLLTSARFDPVNSITLSPSHSHVFLSMQKGDIRTYDVVCRRKSQYTMPDMWKLYEEKMATSGIPSLVPPSPSTAVETVVHPRNLNLLFVAYAGGVALIDLAEKSTVRAYELVFPPGAPGGVGYADPNILAHRRPDVTCMTVHPSGHIFAVGYADGCIAFWATEDDTKPLLVRTLEEDNVNVVDGLALEAHLDGSKAGASLKEPIFKLAWSGFSNSTDPRGGETTLAVLGGAHPSSPPGLTVTLFPAFDPADPPSDQPLHAKNTLHPHFRDAMLRCVQPTKSFYYETPGIIQDFILKGKIQGTPHFAGNYDPEAIIFVLETRDGSRTVSAYQYPPPGFLALHTPSNPQAEEPSGDPDTTPDSTTLPTKSHYISPPLPLRLPLGLGSGVVCGELVQVSNDVHTEFVRVGSVGELNLDLQGGKAYPDETHTKEAKLSKVLYSLDFQPRRILSLAYQDLSIRYFDISTQLLIPKTSVLDIDFPSPFPSLTIQVGNLLRDAIFCGALSCHPQDVAIKSIHTAPEALECAIVLQSGDLIVYSSSSHPVSSSRTDSSIILLNHFQDNSSRLSPYFILSPQRGQITACSVSDTGFLAVAYMDGSLIIVDMRGPTILLHQDPAKKAKRASILPVHLPTGGISGSAHDADAVASLTWTISPLDKDEGLAVRLVALRQSGHGDVFSLTNAGTTWRLVGEPVAFKSVANPIPEGTFVIEGKIGAKRKADRSNLASVYHGGKLVGQGKDNPNLLIVVGEKGVRCSFDITGDRLSKAEWSSRSGSALTAQVVEHNGYRALVVQTDRHDALVYSLPHLEHIQTIQIPSASPLPLSIDESGDFVTWNPDPAFKGIQSIVYGSFFVMRRPTSLPDIDFRSTKKPVPAQPQPVSLGPQSYLGSWFSFVDNQTKTGNQIDEILGGPDRPIPEVPREVSSSGSGETIAGAAASIAAGAAAVQSGLYSRLSSAMAERGQVLNGLEQQFNALEEGSKGMLAQAKKLAAQQTAKGWFGF